MELTGERIYSSEKTQLFHHQDPNGLELVQKTYPGLLQQAEAEFRLTHEYNLTRHIMDPGG